MKRRDFPRAAAASALAACAPTTTTPGPTPDVVSGMSLERKVGQLMSVAFHGTKITSSLEAMIRDRGVGGVILYSENFTDAAGLARLVADLDQIARDAKSLPLFFEIDQEGGPVIRLNKASRSCRVRWRSRRPRIPSAASARPRPSRRPSCAPTV